MRHADREICIWFLRKSARIFSRNSTVKLNWHCVAIAGSDRCQFSFKISSNIYWASIKWDRLVVDLQAISIWMLTANAYCEFCDKELVIDSVSPSAAQQIKQFSYRKESINVDGTITMHVSSASNWIRAEAHSINRARQSSTHSAKAMSLHFQWWSDTTHACGVVGCYEILSKLIASHTFRQRLRHIQSFVVGAPAHSMRLHWVRMLYANAPDSSQYILSLRINVFYSKMNKPKMPMVSPNWHYAVDMAWAECLNLDGFCVRGGGCILDATVTEYIEQTNQQWWANVPVNWYGMQSMQWFTSPHGSRMNEFVCIAHKYSLLDWEWIEILRCIAVQRANAHHQVMHRRIEGTGHMRDWQTHRW